VSAGNVQHIAVRVGIFAQTAMLERGGPSQNVERWSSARARRTDVGGRDRGGRGALSSCTVIYTQLHEVEHRSFAFYEPAGGWGLSGFESCALLPRGCDREVPT